MRLFKQKGFTLIELLVVISIISLLSSVVATSLTSARAKARDSKRIQDMVQMRSALELYRSDTGDYPVPNESGLAEAVQILSIDNPWLSNTGNFAAMLRPYLNKLPTDPLNIGPFINYGKGDYFYWYYKYSTGYVLCTALEAPKTSNVNPLTSLPQGTPYTSGGVSATFPADHGDSLHMFYNGFCVSSF